MPITAIDLTPMLNREVDVLEFCNQFTMDQISAASNQSIDHLLEIVQRATDEQITFIPHDPDADDPEAVAGEEKIGWSLGHLVLHVTASTEEGAAFSSMLARGVELPQDLRLRYEPSWHTHCQTVEDCVERLKESRRMRNAYLETWPADPHLDMYRATREGSRMENKINAKVSFLFGLVHEVGHYEQFEDALEQAQAAHPTQA